MKALALSLLALCVVGGFPPRPKPRRPASYFSKAIW